MTTHRLTRIAAAGLLAAALAACGGGDKKVDVSSATTTTAGAAAPTTDKVQVKDFSFKPKTVTVKAGTTVTWTFDDSADHTVASKSGESEIPESPKLKGGGTYTHTFAKAGSFAYLCTIHNSMTGSVVVTPA
jgi:plastocyanin